MGTSINNVSHGGAEESDGALIKKDSNGGILGVSDSSGNEFFLQRPYLLPAAVQPVTAAQRVCPKSAGLVSVKCVTGTSIALTIYDNNIAASGRVMFSRTMSAGDTASFPSPILAINGIYASYTGTATFDVGVIDAI